MSEVFPTSHNSGNQMKVIEKINGWSVGNECGQYYVIRDNEKIGPFSSLNDACEFARSRS